MIKIATSRVHFIGIGGIGMCGLAELLHNMGAHVTGSDLSTNAQTERLKKIGIHIFQGHNAENVEGAEVIVYSSAVKQDNCEFQEAKRLKTPIIPRAEALAELMKLKRGIAVAGTHGKTTTTSLASSVFLSAGLDPTIVVGGKLESIQSTAQLGKSNWLIAEADESDGSFNRLSPEIVIITNIDNDHIDYYRTFENLKTAFFDFASRIPFFGLAIVCGDDPVVLEVFSEYNKKIVSYGFNATNDYQLKKQKNSYEIYLQGEKLGEVCVPILGNYNALNACAAIVAGLYAGLSFDQAKVGIENFKGVGRRFQFIGETNNILFYDDYGHHPTEVKAVLKAFKENFPQKNFVVLFQPHRYSRTQQCWDEYLTCFGQSDKLIVSPIYPAGEKPIEGISGKKLFDEIHHQNKEFIDKENLVSIVNKLKSGDLVLTLGAGDIGRLGHQLIEKVKT